MQKLKKEKITISGLIENSISLVAIASWEYNQEMLDYYIRYASSDIETHGEYSELFSDFDQLSKILLASSLSPKERFDVINFFMYRNMPKEKGEKIIIFDPEDILNHPLFVNRQEEIQRILESREFNKIMYSPIDELSLYEIALKTDFDQAFKSLKYGNDDFADKIVEINNCFYGNQNKTAEDIEKAFAILESVGVSRELIIPFKVKMLNELKRKETLKNTKPMIKKEPKAQLDYAKITQELENYMDLATCEAKKFATIDEQIHCVYLMRKININTNDIMKYLRSCEIYRNLENINPIAYYNMCFDKLKYYEEKYGLEENIKVLENYFQELIVCNTEDYLFWKNALEEEFKETEKYLPKNGEYELNKGRALLKKN